MITKILINDNDNYDKNNIILQDIKTVKIVYICRPTYENMECDITNHLDINYIDNNIQWQLLFYKSNKKYLIILMTIFKNKYINNNILKYILLEDNLELYKIYELHNDIKNIKLFLSKCILYKSNNIFQYLFEKNINVIDIDSMIYECIIYDRNRIFKYIYEKYINNIETNELNKYIINCSKKGSNKILNYLIDKNINIDIIYTNFIHPKIIKLLLFKLNLDIDFLINIVKQYPYNIGKFNLDRYLRKNIIKISIYLEIKLEIERENRIKRPKYILFQCNNIINKKPLFLPPHIINIINKYLF